jgi:hypothetical protein
MPELGGNLVAQRRTDRAQQILHDRIVAADRQRLRQRAFGAARLSELREQPRQLRPRKATWRGSRRVTEPNALTAVLRSRRSVATDRRGNGPARAGIERQHTLARRCRDIEAPLRQRVETGAQQAPDFDVSG